MSKIAIFGYFQVYSLKYAIEISNNLHIHTTWQTTCEPYDSHHSCVSDPVPQRQRTEMLDMLVTSLGVATIAKKSMEGVSEIG